MDTITLNKLQQRAYSDAATKALARKPALFINNEWVDSSHGVTLPVEDPSSGKEISRIVDASDRDVDRAIAAARAAFDDGRWSGLPPMVRERTINKLADLIEAHAAEFAELEAIDNGKPVGMAAAVDIPGSLTQLRYMAGWASKLAGSTQQPYAMPGGTVFSYTVREPVGVAAQIVPWNFPLLKATLSTSGWRTMRSPAVWPLPVMMLTTPAGKPASTTMSARRSAVRLVCSAGLRMSVHPAASAGAIFIVAINSGKFHGTICAATPTGSRTV
jgi:hypothetical protein